jgi:hypothetical protein
MNPWPTGGSCAMAKCHKVKPICNGTSKLRKFFLCMQASFMKVTEVWILESVKFSATDMFPL